MLAQRLEPHRQPDQNHPDIDRHRQQHAAQRLDLLGTQAARGAVGTAVDFAQLAQPAHAVDQQRHFSAKFALDIANRNLLG